VSPPALPASGARRRASLLSGVLFASILIAGCARPPNAGARFDHQTEQWSGRLGLTVDSEPPQSYSAGFALQGTAEAGELSLSSPLGNVLAVLQWQPGQAWLRQDGQTTRRFASLDELLAAVTGTPLPVRALFAWLHGTPEAADGWQANLDRLADGRLTARRLMPPPGAELRVVLDR
jgi:outer membrane lipoprotein LolB